MCGGRVIIDTMTITTALRRAGLALVYTLLMTVALLQSSSRPLIGPPAPPGPPDLGREILLTSGHIVGFALLTLLWWWALRAWQPVMHALFAAAAFALIFGLITELAQNFVPDRSASTFDLATNWLVTLVTAWAIHRRRISLINA